MPPRSNIKKHESEHEEIDAVQAAIDQGIDVSMLADNLRRSVAERLRRHQIALNMAEKLRKAKRL